jgi:uncharacterized membrane protein HdeD (DUF308 family)
MDYASVQRDVMTGDLVKDWWAKLIIGLILIVWGFLAFVSPELSLLTVIIIFGMMCLFAGIAMIAFALSGSPMVRNKWMMVIEGILLFTIAMMAFFWPETTALTLLYLFAIFAIVLGLFEIIFAISMPKDASEDIGSASRGMMILGGILSLIFGMLLIIYPGSGLLAILWIAGAFAIIIGGIWIATGIAGSREAKAVPAKK